MEFHLPTIEPTDPPPFDFCFKKVGTKLRTLAKPSNHTAIIHRSVQSHLEEKISNIAKFNSIFRGLENMPSATGGIKLRGAYKNAMSHLDNRYFYKLDISNAYDNVNIEILAMLLLCIEKPKETIEKCLPHYDQSPSAWVYHWILQEGFYDQISKLERYSLWLKFLKTFCGNQYGKGLATGGPISPYFMNLYCEAVLDDWFRCVAPMGFLEGIPFQKIRYTRYLDDMVFSSDKPFQKRFRQSVISHLSLYSFGVNHYKSFVLDLKKGPITITGYTIEYSNKGKKHRVLLSQKIRNKIGGIIKSFLCGKIKQKKVVLGYVSNFLFYVNQKSKLKQKLNASETKTLRLCEAAKEKI